MERNAGESTFAPDKCFNSSVTYDTCKLTQLWLNKNNIQYLPRIVEVDNQPITFDKIIHMETAAWIVCIDKLPAYFKPLII